MNYQLCITTMKIGWSLIGTNFQFVSIIAIKIDCNF